MSKEQVAESNILEEYEELKERYKEYQEGILNRKEISEKMKKQINRIRFLVQTMNLELQSIQQRISYVDVVSDNAKFFDILTSLANHNEDEYDWTIINVKHKYSTFYSDGREVKNHEGFVYLCGLKNFIDNIDNEKVYKLFATKEIIQELVDSDHSSVVAPFFEYDLMGDILDRNIERRDFSLEDRWGKAYSFTSNDSLGEAIILLDDYVKEYSGDLDNISVDTVISRIIASKNAKTLKLTRKGNN